MAGARAASLLLASLFAGCRAFAGQLRPKADIIVEGQSAIVNTARDIINNREEKLKVPWQLGDGSRAVEDTGYVGELPLKPEFVPSLHTLALDTVRELQGYRGNIAIGSLKLANGQPAAPPPSYRATGQIQAEGVKYLNGVTSPSRELTHWQYQRSRKLGLDSWLDYLVQRFYDKIVVVFADAVTLYGGCSENIIIYKYQQIIAAANGSKTIVMAAEVTPFPEDLGWKYSLESWPEERMDGVLDYFGVPRNWAEAHADCQNSTHNRCLTPAKYKYANSGLMMGPAWAIRDMFKEIRTYTDVDNRFFNEYYLRHPDIVTLDYAGVLFMSLNNYAKVGSPLPIEIRNDTYIESTSRWMNMNGTNGTNGTDYATPAGATTTTTAPVPQTKKTFHLYNRYAGVDVCFIHGDGRGFPTLKLLAEQLVAYSEEAATGASPYP